MACACGGSRPVYVCLKRHTCVPARVRVVGSGCSVVCAAACIGHEVVFLVKRTRPALSSRRPMGPASSMAAVDRFLPRAAGGAARAAVGRRHGARSAVPSCVELLLTTYDGRRWCAGGWWPGPAAAVGQRLAQGGAAGRRCAAAREAGGGVCCRGHRSWWW